MKKSYYLWETQDGGCDYSIGCGYRLTKIEAESLEEATNWAIKNTIVNDWDAADRVFIIETTYFSEITDKILDYQKQARLRIKRKRQRQEN